jgi:mRNA interferase RelE/StbE
VKRTWIITLSPSAEHDLARLDKPTARRIIAKLRTYEASDDPLALAKPLRGDFVGAYRYRIGDYRAIFEVHEDGTVVILTIIRIKHRKDVYRKR